MVEQATLVETCSHFARTLAGDYAVDGALGDLVGRATALLALRGAGVALAGGDGMRMAAASDAGVEALERAQERTQDGPRVVALRTGAPVLVADLRDEAGRWPALTEAAAELGVVAVAALPLQCDGARLGALDLYATTARDWAGEDLDVGTLAAAMATAYVAKAATVARLEGTIAQLQGALESRVVVEQAKGVLAAERGITVEEAFEVLRRHARAHRADLHATAHAVVRLGLRP